MKKISILFILVFAGLNILGCGDIKIHKSWTDDKSYTQNYPFGLVNMTVVGMCANYHTGQYINMDGKYKLSNILNTLYESTKPQNDIEDKISICNKKLMSKYTPLDIIGIIQLDYDNKKAKKFRNLIATTLQ